MTLRVAHPEACQQDARTLRNQVRRIIVAIILSGVIATVHTASPQTPQPPPKDPATPMLDTGVPNLYYPTAPPMISGASNTDPLLNSPPAPSADLSGGPCTTIPCVLTIQNNNSRTGGVRWTPRLRQSVNPLFAVR